MSVTSPGPSAPVQVTASKPVVRTKPVMGISAGAEDSMYQSKYKVLKRKVKELEADNDRLLFKSLQAKRTVQRLKLERAILYERLVTVPASPEMPKDVPLPSISDAPPANLARPPPHNRPPHQDSPINNNFPLNSRHHDAPHARSISNTWDADDHESMASHGPGLADGRSATRHPESRHPETLPSMYRSNGGPGTSRNVTSMSPAQPIPHPAQYPIRNGNHSHATSPNLPGPSLNTPERHVQPGHTHGHQAQARYPHPRDVYAERLPPLEQGYGDPIMEPGERDLSRQRRREMHDFEKLPRDRGADEPAGGGRMHSRQYDSTVHERGPPPDVLMERSADRETEVEMSKRHEVGEYGGHHSDRYRGQPPSATSHDPHGRQTSGRMHNHQRIGPGTYLNRPIDEHDPEVDREREWEYTRSQPGRPRPPLPPLPPYRQSERDADREYERGNYYDHPPPRHMAVGPSRPPHTQWAGGETPSNSGPASGSTMPPAEFSARPGSPGGHHEADRRAPRLYTLRPVAGEDQDYPMEEHARNHYTRDQQRSGYQYPEVEHPQPPKKRTKRESSPNTVPVHFVDDGPQKIPVTVYDGPEKAHPEITRARRHSQVDREHEEREEHDPREN